MKMRERMGIAGIGVVMIGVSVLSLVFMERTQARDPMTFLPGVCGFTFVSLAIFIE